LHTVDEICAGLEKSGKLQDLFQYVSDGYLKNQRALAARTGSAA
jgi:hypothetical protein